MSNQYKQIIETIDFFHDFILFLRYLQKQPIKRTATGRISLADIATLKSLFNEQKIFDEFTSHGWKIKKEDEIEFLVIIKIIAEVMHLTYKRKDKLLLSKNGKAFLTNLDPTFQYWNMALWYWKKVNWESISPGHVANNVSIVKIFQDQQHFFFDTFLRNGKKWIGFTTFCQALKVQFHLDTFYKTLTSFDRDDFSLYLDVEYNLLKRQFVRFGCIEVEEQVKEHGISRITRFQPTEVGLWMFEEALKNNYF